jgi:hypothetical protein
MTSHPLHHPATLGLALAAAPSLALASAPAPSASQWAWLPLAMALAVGAHIVLGRGLKALVAAISPLASGAPEAAGYERRVYGTASRGTAEIVIAVLASGAVLGLGLALSLGWLTALGALAWLAAMALDLRRWERVSTSADYVWFQRGWGQKVHQVAIENIRDIAVVEKAVQGFTLRHFKRNHVCRLTLRMHDKRVVALPKTDVASGGLADVERTANHVRTRKQLIKALNGSRASSAGKPARSDEERQMLRALKRLRQTAAQATAAVVIDEPEAKEPSAQAPTTRRLPTLQAEVELGKS